MKALLLTLLCAGSLLAAEKPRVIFDTDISGDVDDVLALAMLHSLADRGGCELLGVTISKVNPLTGPFVDAVNTFYGRPEVPIGVTRQAQVRASKYLKLVEEKEASGFRYPHDLASNEAAPEAVELLRKTLAAQPDHSVSIVSVGLAVNLARLLDSESDRFFDGTGAELVSRKVKLLSVMAGAFETVNGNNHYLEANVINDIPSMQRLAQQWPASVPIVWSGFEIGIAVAYPGISIERDFSYVPHHPIREAYLLHKDGKPLDHPTWDLTSVLYAAFPDRGYFDLSPAGSVSVEADGYTRFQPAKSGAGRDRFLIMTPAQAERVREALVQFVVQSPHRHP